MSPMRARYITACQQLLALGFVVVALVPATRVISLDVVGLGPEHGAGQPSISVAPPSASDAASKGAAQACAPLSLRVAERATAGELKKARRCADRLNRSGR